METKIVCSYDGRPIITKHFARTAGGDRSAEKFIQMLYDARKKEAWYFHHRKIDYLKTQLKKYSINARSKVVIRLRGELESLEQDRQELLDILGINYAPQLIQIQITAE